MLELSRLRAVASMCGGVALHADARVNVKRIFFLDGVFYGAPRQAYRLRDTVWSRDTHGRTTRHGVNVSV